MKPWRSDFSLQTTHPNHHPRPSSQEVSPAPSRPRPSAATFNALLLPPSLFLCCSPSPFSLSVSLVRSNQIPGIRGRSARSLGLPRKFSHSYLGAVPIPMVDAGGRGPAGKGEWTGGWAAGWMDDRAACCYARTKTRAGGGRGSRKGSCRIRLPRAPEKLPR